MTNLLEETLKYLKSINKSSDDIIFIGSVKSGYSCTWEEFIKLADIEYDDSTGSGEVAHDLIIIFNDNSWLSRWIDIYEGWKYNKIPIIPKDKKVIKNLIAITNEENQIFKWGKLEDIN